MQFITFILCFYLVGLSQAQTEDYKDEFLKCPAPKQIARIDDGFAVQLNQPNIVYIYAAKSNSFLVLNTKLTYVVILDGTNKIIFHCDTNSGIGGMLNPKLDLVYALVEYRKYFDITKVLDGDFSIAASLISYASLFTDKVISSDRKIRHSVFSNASRLLQDLIITADFTKWVSYGDVQYVNTALYDFNMNITNTVHNILNQYNDMYTAEWSAMIFFAAASEHYKIKEECLSAFINLIVKLVRERDFKFNPKLMNKLYDVVSTQKSMTKKKAIQKYYGILKV